MSSMRGQDSSSSAKVTSLRGNPDGSSDSFDSYVPRKILLAIVLLAVIAGILLGRVATVNLTIPLVIAISAAGLILGTDLRTGWILLFVASTLSTFRIDQGNFTIRPEHIVTIWIIVIWLGQLMLNRVKLHSVPFIYPILALLGMNLLSSFLFSPDAGFSYQNCALLALYMSMFIITVNILSEYQGMLQRIPLLIAVVGVLQAVFGIISIASFNAGFQMLGAHKTYAGIGVAARGGFEEANLLGAFMAVVGLVMFAHIIVNSEWNQRGPYLMLGFTVVMIALMLTFTRAAWVGFMAGAILLVFMLRPKGNFFSPRALAIMLIVGCFFVLVGIPLGNYVTGSTGGEQEAFSDRISNLFNFSEGSGEGRAEIQTRAIERWRTSPLLGLGTFSLPAQEAGRSAVGAWIYSSIIQSLHDTGLIGLIFMLWIYIGGFVMGVRAFLKVRTRFWRATLAGATMGWLALTIASQASSFIWLGLPWIYFGFLVTASRYADKLEADR